MAVAVVAAATMVAGAVPAAGESLTIEDASGDVRRFETETPVHEPRVDITAVAVRHESRSLEIEVSVVQAVDPTDPAWTSGRLSLSAFIVDPKEVDGFFGGVWLWYFEPVGPDGVPRGVLLSFGEDEPIECPTAASADLEGGTYTLLAGADCVRTMPRTVQLGVGMEYDDVPFDDDWDNAHDVAPDGMLSDPIASSGAPEITRLAGLDRIETAIALSADRFDDGAAPAAVLASSENFPDAIAGGPLAARVGGPLLLTGGAGLDPRVTDELERAVDRGGVVYLLGGTGVIGEPIVSQVRAAGFTPRRIAGPNRFETAVAIADEVSSPKMVLIADGRTFREGLIAGAAAAALGGVVVLTDGGALPAATEDYLAHAPVRHVAIGGVAAAAAPGAERITAGSTAELSQRVLDRLLPTVRTLAVAGDRTFADALAGAPHLAALGGGLLLTDGAALSPAVAAELAQRRHDVREVVLYGGTEAISAAVASQIADAVR